MSVFPSFSLPHPSTPGSGRSNSTPELTGSVKTNNGEISVGEGRDEGPPGPRGTDPDTPAEVMPLSEGGCCTAYKVTAIAVI